MRRIERLINLVAALLDSRRPMSAEEIRSRIAGYDQPSIEAFRRAFERDKQDLREMGIPIEVVQTDPFKDQADAYTIPPADYYLPDLDLADDELAALRMAADAVLGMGEEAHSGFMKLAATSSDLGSPGPRLVAGADVAAEQPVLPPLLTALFAHSPVSFEYETPSGERGRREVEPYGLVHRGGNWYLVGRDVERAAPRTFKLARMTSGIAATEGSYEIPDGFELDSHLAGREWEVGELRSETSLRFDPEIRWWAEQNMSEAPSTEEPDGALVVTTPLGNADALVSWVIGFGGAVQIVAPPDARQRLLDHLAPLTRAR